MQPAFPNRYVDKGDPQYERWFRYVFVLQPPLQGATARDFVRYAQELKSGLEAKALSDSDSIPRSSFAGQELTLQSLKDEVTEIISRSPIEWIRGCVGISFMHHPEKREKLVSVLSKLPQSAHPEQKLLSVRHADDVFAFNVQLHEHNFIPTDGLYIWLDNPSDPVAEHVVPSDRGESLTIRDVYESKQKMEYFAMMSLCIDLLKNTSLTDSDLECRYEPLGNVFPDFELIVRDQEWAVEVTRIESGMVAYLRVSEPLKRDSFNKAARKQVTDSGIIAALTKALDDKTKRRNDCSSYSRACLLLVDVVHSIDTERSAISNGLDLTVFDAVALVKLDGRVYVIKGAHALESVSLDGKNKRAMAKDRHSQDG